jgi:hypothetical protein
MVRLARETLDVWCRDPAGGTAAGAFAMLLYSCGLARGDRERMREIAAVFVEGTHLDADTGLAILTGEIEHRIEGDGSLVFMIPL